MNKKWLRFPLFSILFLLAGTLLYYLFGYKDSWLTQMAAYCLIVYGWIMVFFSLIILHPANPKKSTAKNKTLQWIKHRAFFVLYIGWLGLLCYHFFQLDPLLHWRMERIINSGKAGDVNATVTTIESRFNRSGTNYFAIIEYPTPGGVIKQAIADNQRRYEPGQVLHIKYALEYPDMFLLVPPDLLKQ